MRGTKLIPRETAYVLRESNVRTRETPCFLRERVINIRTRTVKTYESRMYTKKRLNVTKFSLFYNNSYRADASFLMDFSSSNQ